MKLVLAITRPMSVALALGAMAAAALGAANFASAAPIRSNVDGNLVDVSVQVDGTNAPLFWKPGTWDRTYFEAFRGRNYSLVVTNQTNARVGVLIAVDGLNVVNGQRTALDNHEAMYVLDPYESTTIQGWRTSLNDVRRFVFVDEDRSYASRTDQANGDMGWIRVLSFREQAPRVTWRDDRPWLRGGSGGRDDQRNLDEPSARREGSAAPESRADGAPASPAPGAKDELRAQKTGQLESAPRNESAPGTGWGDHRYDPVSRTVFLAMTQPTDRITLRYEYRSGLQALGIYPRQPRVFERERGEVGFAQPPRW